MKTADLPVHLQRYAVDQTEREYTSVDHAVWRFILRQLQSFLKTHAHPAYLEGMAKTGIEIEQIPSIANISAHLSKFGWRAIPVSGFIPPAAFMELQAMSILPVAMDIRSLDHLLYTPAPDIVHEAAGHAPLLADPEYSDYLKQYSQIARKAILSKHDMEVYSAIRELSDLKENPMSTMPQLLAAEQKLLKLNEKKTTPSEATWLSRMNWWTAEYGLIGDLQNPRIFGAGLLSSVGEARWCLSDHVKKIPISIDCINYSYDITEPQPHLFVTPSFEKLVFVLDELSERMAYKIGGLEGVERAIAAQTVNTVVLNSGLQISGQCTEVLTVDDDIAYLKFTGPSQLSVNNEQFPGHGTDYHKDGFGTAVGFLKAFPRRCPSTFGDKEWDSLNVKPKGKIRLDFESGLVVTGEFNGRFVKDGKSILLSLENAEARLSGRVLFDPSWGVLDLALGSSVTSVFGGPADRALYGQTDDFKPSRVPAPVYTAHDVLRQKYYSEVRSLRESQKSQGELSAALKALYQLQDENFSQDWLFVLELFELEYHRGNDPALAKQLRSRLEEMIKANPVVADVVRDGLELACLKL